MSSGLRNSRWLGPALGAGFSAGAIAGGYGGFAPAANQFGGWLGNLIKTYTGFGEYSIRSNSLYEGAQVPFVRNTPHVNGTTISHREYLMDVITSPTPGEFQIQAFDLNPGLPGTFEWLSQIAVNYEEYTLEGCLFVFRSMSADALNSTNTTLGTIMMATQYNMYQPNFQNKAEMESHAYSMSGKPSDDMIHPIECDPHQSQIVQFYTRNGPPPTGADLRLYDIGRFQIATQGFQAASVNIGELHVTYQVTLTKQRLYSALGRGIEFVHHTANQAAFGSSGIFGALATFPATPSSNMVLEDMSYFDVQTLEFYLPRRSSPIIYSITIAHLDMALARNFGYLLSGLQNCTDMTSGFWGVASGANSCPQSLTSETYHTATFFIRTAGSFLRTRIRIGVAAPVTLIADCFLHLVVSQSAASRF